MGSKTQKTKVPEKKSASDLFDKIIPKAFRSRPSAPTPQMKGDTQVHQPYEEFKMMDENSNPNIRHVSNAQMQSQENIHDLDEMLAISRQDSVVEGHQCNICYNIMVEPTDFNPYCSHRFCIQCVQKFLSNSHACPYCRADIPKTFTPTVNIEFQQKIKRQYREEFEIRYKALELDGSLFGDQIEIEFEVGNHYIKLDEAMKSREGDNEVTIQCTPFVRFKDKAIAPLTSLFINDVQFKLCRCPNENCENTITKKPKCNNCENCLKKQDGIFVEPDYEIGCTLNCWQKMDDMPMVICFSRPISNAPEEKCDCCDKLKKTSYLHYSTTVDLQYDQDTRCETVKVSLQKNKVVKMLMEENDELATKNSQQDTIAKTSIEYLLSKIL